jgi:hypothetical protein
MPTPTAQISIAARAQPTGIVSCFSRTWSSKNPVMTPAQMRTQLPGIAAPGRHNLSRPGTTEYRATTTTSSTPAVVAGMTTHVTGFVACDSTAALLVGE